MVDLIFHHESLFILILCSLCMGGDGSILTMNSQIVSNRAFQPNTSFSVLATIQLPSTTYLGAVDCAHLCLRTGPCQTAVFGAQNRSCMMYAESVTITSPFLINATPDFTTIITDKPLPDLVFISSLVPVFPVCNTTAGGDSTPATSGSSTCQYWHAQSPSHVFDRNWETPFCSYGSATAYNTSSVGGRNTGVYLTVPGSPFILAGFRFVKGNFGLTRDPLRITIEGSNQTGAPLTLGSSWTLIYNGTAGLDIDPGSFQAGVKQLLSNNTLVFSSYRFLIVEPRSSTTCTEYTEIELYRS